MSEEKVLAYLNLDKHQKIDKGLMGIAFWFDVSFTWTVILVGLLLEAFTFSEFDIVFIVVSIITNIVFFIWYKKSVNPVDEIWFSIIVLGTTAVKLFYGYVVFSKSEAIENGYPQFGLIYIIVLLVFLLIDLYMWQKSYRVFQDLKTNTIKQAKKNIEKKKGWFWWIPVIGGGSSMVYVRLFKGNFENMGLGIGFALWVLACIWLCLALMLVPKYVVCKRYKVADYFKNQEIK